jgi:hypothetical protein
MRTAFVKGKAPEASFAPFDHLPNQVPLDQGVTPSVAASKSSNHSVEVLKAAWLRKKAQIFAGKLTKPDAEDPDTVNHLNWYQSTGFTRPYPGESVVRHPKEFANNAVPQIADRD